MKKSKSFFRFLVFTAIIISGCAQKNNQEQDDIAAIHNLFNRYVQSAEAHDLETFMTCWEEEGMRAEPGLPVIMGKENIRNRFEEIFSAPVDFKITPLGEPMINIVDDIAYTLRTVTLSATPRDGSPALVQDMNVLSIIRRQADGSWKAYIDCINYHPTWSMYTIPGEMFQDNPYY